jgi:CRISPR-associated endonuclease/helicase Cas3
MTEFGPAFEALTGTIRGHERDRLVARDPVFRALLDHEQQPPRSVYLVSTSAGEVGIDLDADEELATSGGEAVRLAVSPTGGERC